MSRPRTPAVPHLPSRLREEQLSREGFRNIAGVDEVGVGPLAGPVVAAAVILPVGFSVQGVRDSKLIDEAERILLEAEILGCCVASSIGQASVAEIDTIGIYEASALAMCRAIVGLAVPPGYAMVDARRLALDLPQEGPVRGDREHTCIAAASILAKQFRDRLMDELDGRHPGYGFAEHKGYPTPKHLGALSRQGTSPVHRVSWLAVREAAGLLTPLYYEFAADTRALESVAAAHELDRRLRSLRGTIALDEYERLRELFRRRSTRLRSARPS